MFVVSFEGRLVFQSVSKTRSELDLLAFDSEYDVLKTLSVFVIDGLVGWLYEVKYLCSEVIAGSPEGLPEVYDVLNWRSDVFVVSLEGRLVEAVV